MKYAAPKFKKRAFTCPNCGAYSQMVWGRLSILVMSRKDTNYWVCDCVACSRESIWWAAGVDELKSKLSQGFNPISGKMIYPEKRIAPLPAEDMPEDVKFDYEEAAKIASKSPRAAAALLRLGLQKLCVHLGKKGKSIDVDIRALATDGILPADVIKAADTMRITGNNCVHPGEMNDEDRDHVASKMFGLLNFIVEKAITDPKELKALYEKTPEYPRKDAEARDAKAKKKESS